jgi:hypothetical protein
MSTDLIMSAVRLIQYVNWESKLSVEEVCLSCNMFGLLNVGLGCLDCFSVPAFSLHPSFSDWGIRVESLNHSHASWLQPLGSLLQTGGQC